MHSFTPYYHTYYKTNPQTHAALLYKTRTQQRYTQGTELWTKPSSWWGLYDQLGTYLSSIWVNSRSPTFSKRNNSSSWRLKMKLLPHRQDIKREVCIGDISSIFPQTFSSYLLRSITPVIWGNRSLTKASLTSQSVKF